MQVGTNARSYDAVGNTTAMNGATLTFDDRNRLVAYQGTQSASYQYNGRGERVTKSRAGAVIGRFVYDEAEQVLVEENSDSGANVRSEVLWLDSLPVGIVRGGVVYSIQADQLGTARVAVDTTRNVALWAWDIAGGGVFGDGSDNADVDGDGSTWPFRMRFPGQWADSESGVSYNYWRDYEPASGRYMESDPIGLEGGLSTYGYVLASPLLNSDPLGLESGALHVNPEYRMVPRFSFECGDYCNCLANCIRANDPAIYLEKMAMAAAGGTFPKAAAGLPRGLGGASPVTTVPSAGVHFAQKCYKIPKIVVRGARTVGRAFSPVFVGYGLGMATVELGCAAACADNSALY